jgi:hypothetical protein
MNAKVVTWPRKRELCQEFEHRLNHVIAASGEIEAIRLFERGDFVDVVLLISDAPGSGQTAMVMAPDELDEVIDAMNLKIKKRETNAKLIGLLALAGGRYVGTVITRPNVEVVKRDANEGQDAKSDGGAKRGKQRGAVAPNRRTDGGDT